jgi:hypothetical protein
MAEETVCRAGVQDEVEDTESEGSAANDVLQIPSTPFSNVCWPPSSDTGIETTDFDGLHDPSSEVESDLFDHHPIPRRAPAIPSELTITNHGNVKEWMLRVGSLYPHLDMRLRYMALLFHQNVVRFESFQETLVSAAI